MAGTAHVGRMHLPCASPLVGPSPPAQKETMINYHDYTWRGARFRHFEPATLFISCLFMFHIIFNIYKSINDYMPIYFDRHVDTVNLTWLLDFQFPHLNEPITWGVRHGSNPNPKGSIDAIWCNLIWDGHTWSIFPYTRYTSRLDMFGESWCLFIYSYISLQTEMGICWNVEERPATASEKNWLEKSLWLASDDVGWKGW